MSSQEVGPEWVLSSFPSPSPGTQDHINVLAAVAHRIWPRIRAHAVKEQPHKTPDEAIAVASEIWESALESIGRTMVRSNGKSIPILNLEAYLFGVFIHRFNRTLKKERKRREMFLQVTSGCDLESVRQAHDPRAAREIEQSVQIREAVESMNEWTRKVWIARKYGYSWREIASFHGITEIQAKLKFRYALGRLRRKWGF